MTVSEVLAFFTGEKNVQTALKPLADGLEYLRLGQPVPHTRAAKRSGKLAGHLAGGLRGARAAVFFDEPTTGLHFDDIARLLHAFRQLIAAGHSLVVIEHNLDVMRASDWIIDLGPEGGDAGGEMVCQAPQDVMQHAGSHTGRRARIRSNAWRRDNDPPLTGRRGWGCNIASSTCPPHPAPANGAGSVALADGCDPKRDATRRIAC